MAANAPTPLRSLSLRLSTIFIALLIGAAIPVGCLFDRGRTEAIAQARRDERQHQADRVADEIAGFVSRLHDDLLFLAATPPISGIQRAADGGGVDALGASSLQQWEERLRQIFLAFAKIKPEYVRLRYIDARGQPVDLVRIDRDSPEHRPPPPVATQDIVARLSPLSASQNPADEVRFAITHAAAKHGAIEPDDGPVLSAAIPIRSAKSRILGILLIELDLEFAFRRASYVADIGNSLDVLDEQGKVLLRARPSSRLGSAPLEAAGSSGRMSSRVDSRLDTTELEALTKAVTPGSSASDVAFSSRAWDPGRPERQLRFVVTGKSADRNPSAVGPIPGDALLGMGTLLSLAFILIVWMVHRATRSLRTLAAASQAIANGDYRVQLPIADGSEVGSLTLAFRRMAVEIQEREDALEKLNRDLESRVDQRTRELSYQRDLLRLILESIGDGVIVTDAHGRFVLCNHRASQLVGCEAEKTPPEHWSTSFGVFRAESGDPMPEDEIPLVRAIRGQTTDNQELYLHHPGREKGYWVQMMARPLRDSKGDSIGAVAVLVDVTDQKALRERLHKHRRKLVEAGRLMLGAEVASTAAHQLSQPLAAISNFVGAALRLYDRGQLKGDELRSTLVRVEQLSTRCGAILDRLRERIRRRTPVAVPFDVNDAVQSCLDALKERIDGQAVQIDTDYAPEIPRIVGDPIELEHALAQLVTNALDAMEATPAGRRRLGVTTSHDAGSGVTTIEMRDTGPGISPAIAGRLFEPWETNKPGALGIGLSVAQTIISTLGGEISVLPRTNGGAVFRVELAKFGSARTLGETEDEHQPISLRARR